MSSLPPETLARIRGLEQRVLEFSHQLQQSTHEQEILHREMERHAGQMQEMRKAARQQLARYRSMCTAFEEVVRERDEAREQREIAREQRELARDDLLLRSLASERELRDLARQAEAKAAQKDELIARLLEESYVARQSLERLGQRLVATRVERDGARSELARAALARRLSSERRPEKSSPPEPVELTEDRDRLSLMLQTSRDLYLRQRVSEVLALPAQMPYARLSREQQECREATLANLMRKVLGGARRFAWNTHVAHVLARRVLARLLPLKQPSWMARMERDREKKWRNTARILHWARQQSMRKLKKKMRARSAKNGRVKKNASQLVLDSISEEHSPAVKPEELPLVAQAETSCLPTESDIKKEEPIETSDGGPSWNSNVQHDAPLYNCEMTVPKEEDDEASVSLSDEQRINKNPQFLTNNSPARGNKPKSRPRKRKPT